MTIFKKTLSFFLCLAVSLTPVPQKTQATEQMPAPVAAVETASPQIVGEVLEKREKNVKHFLNEDLSYTAAVYPTAVHYLENGKLVDIDNRLIEGVDDTSMPVLENQKNAYKVKIAKNSNASKLVSIKKDQYEISWNLAGGDKTKAVVVVPEGTLPEDKKILPNLQSTVRYEEILPRIDLEYVIMAEEVKENLILKSRMEVPELVFSLTLKNLVPALEEGGRILFRDPATGKEVMEMPAPFMVDALGEASFGVEAGLTEVKAGSEYRLTLKADNSWLADEARAYPVILDPVVSTTVEQTKIFDAPVSSAYPNTNYVNMGLLKAGYGASSYVNRSYLQFTLPSLTTADLIVDASLNLATFTSVVTPRQIEVYKVNSAWNSSTITWNNKPAYNSGKAEEYQMASGSSGSRFDWDITGIVKEWYSTGVNNGLLLKNTNESASGYYLDFHSSDTSYGEAYRPQITISYVNNSGLEGYWTYHSQSVGRAGTGYVNDYNGNLVLVHGDIALTGSRLPLSLSHVWNSNEASTDMGYGAGWRTSLSQSVVPRTIDGVQYYAYTDEDGTIHYFRYDSAKGKYVDESGIDLTLVINSASAAERYVLTDKGGNSLAFSSLGKLGKIRDLEGNQMTLAYGGNGALSTVTDGSGRTLTLSTDSTGRLLSMTDPAGRSTSYTYNGTQLERITYPDGKSSTYTYDGNRKLLTATNHDGYRIGWSYYAVAPYRVKKIAETTASGTLGGELSLSYGYNTTVFTDYLGKSQAYQFNNQGNTLSVKDNEGYASNYGYGTEAASRNKITLESKLQKTVVNELKNHGGEKGTDWTLEQHNGSSGTLAYVTDQKQLGNQSIRIIKAGSGGTVFASQALTLAKGKTYTLSAYMKTNGVTSGNAMGALAAVRYQDASGWKYAYGKYVSGTNDWARVEVSFPLSSNALSGSVYACVGIEGESGIAWFDSLQLEEGPMANRYNLVQNGDFRQGLDGWSSWNFTTEDGLASTSDPSHPGSLDANVLKIKGDAGTSKCLVQDIPVSGNEGDVFVMGGWAKGASAPISGLRYFALDLAIRRTNGTTQWAVVSFNEDSGDWQYLSAPIIADASYSSVSIHALYYLNLNTASFDGIQLYKEAYGQSYQYDANGNVTSTVDLAKQNASFQYNGSNDLVKSVDPKGNAFTYEYSADGKRRLSKATSAENVVYSFEYDSFGNPKKAKVGSTLFMESSSTYTASGAYASAVTDSSGNSVSYSYNESKGTLTGVTDPKGKATTYSYDAATDALTSVSRTLDGSVVTNGYAYENDRLKTITHNGFSYTFGYDALGNNTTVKAGSQNLITSSFDLRSGRLLESTYGNGHKVATDYDNLDRIATYKVWNSATGQYEVKFRYAYDASGNLGYQEDLVNGTSYRYVYDLADRLAKITGSDGSSLTNGFDGNDNVSGITETGNGTSFTTAYAYDKDNRPLKVTLGNGAFGSTAYDAIGRASGSAITIGGTVYNISYTYHPGVNGSATARVASMTNNGSAIAYTYDQNGNIETITEGAKLTKYTYNELSEVIREDNGTTNKSITYRYNAGGNLLEKKEYAYTTGVLGTAISTIPYTYGDANWKDNLTAYNGKAITYDAIGNPLTYDGWTYAWENGRQLKSLSNGTQNLTFKYNDAGIRTEKTVNGVTTKYTLFGDRVAFETKGSDKIHYSYDASGNLFSMNLNGTEYYYIRNAQGDITGLIDGVKNLVVSYTYDTWGKLISTTGSLAGTLGVKNPYRYRGYRYDTETGFYSLQSRYYDPEIGRFINADSQLNPQSGLTGMNLFCYGGNNPINTIDPTGHAFMFLTAAIGAIAGAVVGGVVGYVKTGTVKGALIGAGIGAVAGGLIGLGAGALAGTVLAGSATASTAAVVAGAGTVLSQAGNAISTGVSKVSNAISKIGSKSTTVYRSVSEAEASSIKALDKFTTLPGQMEVKQFAFSLQETIKFGQKYGQNLIAKASVPSNMLNQFYLGGAGGIDTKWFPSGTLTVYGDMLDAFNQAVAGSIQIMP